MRTILVLGQGITGTAVATYLRNKGYRVSVTDSLMGCTRGHFDFAIISPGIPPQDSLYREVKSWKIPMVGEMEFAAQLLPSRHRCIGITGTNGKTTLVSLVTHVLQHTGRKARAVGNIGIPLISVIDHLDPEEILVVELSSYQLETMKTPIFDVGMITNLQPDHLDRYANFTEYASAKFRISMCIKEGGCLYIDRQTANAFGETAFIKRDFCIYNACPELALTLVERLNNMLPCDRELAVAGFCIVEKLGVSLEEFCSAWGSFCRPPHRIEYMGRYGDVDFYNDSKATNVSAVAFALSVIDRPVWLIMGGKRKGIAFDSLIPDMLGKVRKILTIGEAAEEIEKVLGKEISYQRAETLRRAVDLAIEAAGYGEAVVLSPGCSSLDQFKNYEDRGDTFKLYVKERLL